MESRSVFLNDKTRGLRRRRSYAWERWQGDYDWSQPTTLRDGAAVLGILAAAFVFLCVASEVIGHGGGNQTAFIPTTGASVGRNL